MVFFFKRKKKEKEPKIDIKKIEEELKKTEVLEPSPQETQKKELQENIASKIELIETKIETLKAKMDVLTSKIEELERIIKRAIES